MSLLSLLAYYVEEHPGIWLEDAGRSVVAMAIRLNGVRPSLFQLERSSSCGAAVMLDMP